MSRVSPIEDGWRIERSAPGPFVRDGIDFSIAIVTMGALATEALAAWEMMIDDLPGLGLLVVTSSDLLHREWSPRLARPHAVRSHVEMLLADLATGAGLVTLLDGAPGALSWLGGVDGRRVSPLGVDRFGQTGDLPDLYHQYRLDPDAVVDATAALFAG